ncbi:hypothetical protein D3W54_07015 [Komagataeibacter medellinensis]|uniref:Uncharacterized protein n=1 Tax=Komagataeibacter medellinensis TaxID=1177712 RepID=A0ABQ6VUV9_9PROT|nr:hypothetical protein [Komagataeibacter medellinensis]KAB8123992.1 hypothetical protein D3W54_07015 [Komagataeibacter medellinensis]
MCPANKKYALWVISALGVLALLAMTGCASRPDRVVCPTLTTYSAADQKALSSELAADPNAPTLHRAMRDYEGLRDQVRACEKAAD